MNLAELSIQQFCDLLASDLPAPGGGAGAALSGALGVCLTSMVCALTVGKPKYADLEEQADEGLKEAWAIKADFLTAMEQDAASFRAVSAAYAMPKETQEEKTARSEAIQAGLEGCTQPPFAMMELSVQALELTRRMLGHTNPSAVSDLGVAALSLKAAIQSAWLNVKINIGMMKNETLAQVYRSQGEKLLERAIPLADEIYETVLDQL